jgi:hypothetical protein
LYCACSALWRSVERGDEHASLNDRASSGVGMPDWSSLNGRAAGSADWSFREHVLFYNFIKSSDCEEVTARSMWKSYRGVLPAALEFLE